MQAITSTTQADASPRRPLLWSSMRCVTEVRRPTCRRAEIPWTAKSRSWAWRALLQREQLLRPLDSSEGVPADGGEADAVFGPRGGGEGGGYQDVLLDGAAQGSDAARLVDRRAYNREVEAVLAPDVAVEDLADVKPQVGSGDRQPTGGAVCVDRGDSNPHQRLRFESGGACLACVGALENG